MSDGQSHLAALATRISGGSALNPGLLLCLIVCPVVFLGSISLYAFHLPLPASVLAAIGCYPLVITGWQLVHFTRNDPNRLQREQHIERMFEIKNTISVKDGTKMIDLPTSTRMIQNPTLRGNDDE